jgi:hypothetical protein
MELLKSLLKPLFKYYRQRTRKSLLPTFSTSMVGGPMQHLHKAKHGKKGRNLSLHGVVLVGAHVGPRVLK